VRITLQQIEAFYWAAKLGSFHAAARHLNFTQPAISARIRELESVLEMRLFDRSRQRVALTLAGRNALGHAERLLGAGQDLERLRGGGPPLQGLLRLGADESSAMMGLTEILAWLRMRHPGLRVELTLDIGAVLNDKLASRELDLAMHTWHGAPLAPHVIGEQLGWIEFQWVAAPGLAIPVGEFLPAHAAALPIVTNSPPSTLNGLVKTWLRNGGYDFDAFNSCNSLWLMQRLAEAGHAIAVLPAAVVRRTVSEGRLRVLQANPPLPPVAFSAFYLSEERGQSIGTVIDIIRGVLVEARFFAALAPAAPTIDP